MDDLNAQISDESQRAQESEGELFSAIDDLSGRMTDVEALAGDLSSQVEDRLSQMDDQWSDGKNSNETM